MAISSSFLVVRDDLVIPRDEFRFSFVRSSGPGGQHVNKVNTKAVLHWDVTGSPSLPQDVRDRFVARFARRVNAEGELVLSSQRYRDQSRNVQDCLAKLRELILAVATPPTPRKKTRPPRQAKEARLRQKRATAAKKQLRRPPTDTD